MPASSAVSTKNVEGVEGAEADEIGSIGVGDDDGKVSPLGQQSGSVGNECRKGKRLGVPGCIPRFIAT